MCLPACVCLCVACLPACLQGLIVFSRVGVYLRLPGVDVERFSEAMQGSGGIMSYIDTLSGGWVDGWAAGRMGGWLCAWVGGQPRRLAAGWMAGLRAD